MKITINSKTAGKFKKEYLNNREHIVTEMVPIVGDSVMNGGLYPFDEIKASYLQIDNLPAPNGHPKVNGEIVSAFHPLAINAHNIGGFVRNPRLDNKRVINEFWLDTEIANQSDDGKELIRRIENGEEVGVSTGLTVRQENKAGDTYTWVARDLRFDHVAILLNEKAAGAHVGTKLTVNSSDLIISQVKFETNNAGVRDVKGLKDKIIQLVTKAFAVNSMTVQDISNGLHNALKAKYPGDGVYFWVCDIMPTESKFAYEVGAEGEPSKTYLDSYTVADDFSVSISGSPVEVARRTEYKPVTTQTSEPTPPASETEGEANMKDQPKTETPPNEENIGDGKGPGGPGKGNEAAADDADKAAMDEAVKLLESKGYTVTKSEEANQKEGDDSTVTNAEDAEVTKLRDEIITNSAFSADELKDLGKDALTKIAATLPINRPQNFGLAGGRNPLRAVANSKEGDYLETYTPVYK